MRAGNAIRDLNRRTTGGSHKVEKSSTLDSVMSAGITLRYPGSKTNGVSRRKVERSNALQVMMRAKIAI